jgi:hypothetical protein
VITVEYSRDPRVLGGLAEKWLRESQTARFGLNASVSAAMDDLKGWLDKRDGTIILARKRGEPCGFLAVFRIKSFLSDDFVALEKYWYGHPMLRLLKEARKWARTNGCTHLIASASHLASSRYDGICRLYERLGLEKFETSYIWRLT